MFVLNVENHFQKLVIFLLYLSLSFITWQSKLALKPDGLFLAAIFGGETLRLLPVIPGLGYYLAVFLWERTDCFITFFFQGAKDSVYCSTNGAGRRRQSPVVTFSTSMSCHPRPGKRTSTCMEMISE